MVQLIDLDQGLRATSSPKAFKDVLQGEVRQSLEPTTG